MNTGYRLIDAVVDRLQRFEAWLLRAVGLPAPVAWWVAWSTPVALLLAGWLGWRVWRDSPRAVQLRAAFARHAATGAAARMAVAQTKPVGSPQDWRAALVGFRRHLIRPGPVRFSTAWRATRAGLQRRLAGLRAVRDAQRQRTKAALVAVTGTRTARFSQWAIRAPWPAAS